MVKKFAGVFLAALLALTLFACGSEPVAKDVDLHAVMAQMESKVEIPEMVDWDKDAFQEKYGVGAADVKQFIAKTEASGTKVDEIILVEAVDSDAAARVKTKLEDRKKSRENETQNYQPEEYAVIQNSEVKQQGNFVTLIISPDAKELTDIFNEALK